MTENYNDLLERLDEAHAEEKKFRMETFGVRDYDPYEPTLHSEAAEAIRALVPQGPGRMFKLGDKVQEVTDDEEKPWGYVIEEREIGQWVQLENTKYAGRMLMYFDEEIEPYAEAPDALFKVGQKVELLKGYSGNGMVLTAGLVGRVKSEIDGVYEVVFSTQSGTFGMSFAEGILKAAE